MEMSIQIRAPAAPLYESHRAALTSADSALIGPAAEIPNTARMKT
jgi:hypothetical protein